MEIKTIAVASIKEAAYNPASRTATSVKWLQDSIETHGLLYPLLVDQKMRLIDGHRRLQVAKNLGWESVPVLIAEGDQAVLYGEIGTTSKKLSGNEMLRVFLAQPLAIQERVREKMEIMQATCGRNVLETMANRGMSYAIFKRAQQIANYLDVDDDKFLARIVKWFIRCGTADVARALAAGIPKRVLLHAIRGHKDLLAKYSAP